MKFIGPAFNARGFNLVEIALALVLFAIAIPAIGRVFALAYQQGAENTNTNQAIFLANALMDEISERRFMESAGSPGNCADVSEISSLDRRGFDDIDDYSIFEKDCIATTAWGPLNPPRDQSGTSLADYSKFSQLVTVKNLKPPTTGPTARADFSTQTEGTTDFKLVTVKITWNNARNSIELNKVFAKH